jgi:hypothetical protein
VSRDAEYRRTNRFMQKCSGVGEANDGDEDKIIMKGVHSLPRRQTVKKCDKIKCGRGGALLLVEQHVLVWAISIFITCPLTGRAGTARIIDCPSSHPTFRNTAAKTLHEK